MSNQAPKRTDLDTSAPLDGVHRVETHAQTDLSYFAQMIQPTYPHDQIYGQYCTVHGYIDAPPGELHDWLSHPHSLEEWTFSLRGFRPTSEEGLWEAVDELNPGTSVFIRAVANPDARTVDYHRAWDQDRHLWMVYLLRVVDASTVLDKPGSVLLWTNCRHPRYDDASYPGTVPWDGFWAGHQLELDNLTRIAEHRHRHGLPLTPDWMRV